MTPGEGYFELSAQVRDVTELLPEVVHRDDIWYIIGNVQFSTHTFTHIEVPYQPLGAGR